MIDLMERITVMLRQESTTYSTRDYLEASYQRKLTSPEDPVCALGGASAASSSSSTINEVWREKICEWSFQVIDHFDFSREVVSVSIHYLDMYLSTRTVNKKIFQLAAMTCLFLAIKLHESGNISMASMIELSRGYFTVEQMEAMELSILRSLKWSLHPPTPFTVLKHVILLLPFAVVPAEARHDILELSRFLTELSVIDYFFVPHRSSDIGMAAMLNAMEAIPYVTDVMVATFVQELHTTVGIDVTRPEIQQCRTRLRLLYLQGGYARPDEASAEVRCASISPVCVSYGVNVAHQQHPESAKAAPVTQTCSVLSESALVS